MSISNSKFILGLFLVFSTTIFAIAALLEVGALVFYTEHVENKCSKLTSAGVFIQPNCTSQPIKLWEGPWYTYSSNDCGYRSESSCSISSKGDKRVAVMGTSISNGMYVAYPDTFSARAETILRSRCQTSVDFQNLALPAAAIDATPVWHRVLDRMPEAIGLRPDAIVMVVSALDLKYYNESPFEVTTDPFPTRAQSGSAGGLQAITGLVGQIKHEVAISLPVRALRKMMFSNGPTYLSHYLKQDDAPDFLYRNLSPKWQMRLQVAESIPGQMAVQAQQAHIPLIVIYYPTYPQAVAAQLPNFAPDFSPLGIDERIGEIVKANGARFVDLTPVLAKEHDLPSLFYVSNDHPNGAGNRIIADDLVRTLISDVSVFATCGGGL